MRGEVSECASCDKRKRGRGSKLVGFDKGWGRMEWVVDLVLLSVPLISHVPRCTPSHLEECALDSHLPLEVSSC